VVARFAACNWHTVECDGMDGGKVSKAIDEATRRSAPITDPMQDDHRLWRANKQGTAATHGAALGADEVARRPPGTGLGLRRRSRFPTMLPRLARGGARGTTERAEWHRRLDASDKGSEFRNRLPARSMTAG
jgi:transketolase